MSASEPVLHANGIDKIYKQGAEELSVLRGLELRIDVAEQIAIIGSSGCGKSTLLHVLAGLDTPDSGKVTIDSRDVYDMSATARGYLRAEKLGFVYQFHHLLAEFTAVENVAMPLLIARQSTGKARKAASDLLKKVGLGERLDHKPAELSGGERQRAAIARALINQPKLIMADEPTGNLDEDTAAYVFELMLDLKREFDTAFLIVTHDTRLASQMETVYRLSGGRLNREEALGQKSAAKDSSKKAAPAEVAQVKSTPVKDSPVDKPAVKDSSGKESEAEDSPVEDVAAKDAKAKAKDTVDAAKKSEAKGSETKDSETKDPEMKDTVDKAKDSPDKTGDSENNAKDSPKK